MGKEKTYTEEQIKTALATASYKLIVDLQETAKKERKNIDPSLVMMLTLYTSYFSSKVITILNDGK